LSVQSGFRFQVSDIAYIVLSAGGKTRFLDSRAEATSWVPILDSWSYRTVDRCERRKDLAPRSSQRGWARSKPHRAWVISSRL